MPLITGEEIARLVELFEQRNVRFYHACQYKDFKSYLHLGGVPSRELLNQRRLNYTRFDTDNRDQTNAVWSKVFGNLSDFGAPFFNGRDDTASIPPPYGPILLVFSPRVFEEASDMAICLRSAGAIGFNREDESISSIDDVNRLFIHENIDVASGNQLSWIKQTQQLRNTFGDGRDHSPEISCTTELGMLSFDHLRYITVDPYNFNGNTLCQLVEGHAINLGINVYERTRSSATKIEIINSIKNLLLESNVTPQDLQNNLLLSPELRNYANRVNSQQLSYQLDRFLRYLREGTVLEVFHELRHI